MEEENVADIASTFEIYTHPEQEKEITYEDHEPGPSTAKKIKQTITKRSAKTKEHFIK